MLDMSLSGSQVVETKLGTPLVGKSAMTSWPNRPDALDTTRVSAFAMNLPSLYCSAGSSGQIVD